MTSVAGTPERTALRERVAAAIRSIGHEGRNGDVTVYPATAADAVLPIIEAEVAKARREALEEAAGAVRQWK